MVDLFSCDLNAGHSGLSISLLLLDRREISQRHHTHDAHIFVHNGQILKVMLPHDFSCLILRLMFEAIINFFTMIPRTSVVSGSWPKPPHSAQGDCPPRPQPDDDPIQPAIGRS